MPDPATMIVTGGRNHPPTGDDPTIVHNPAGEIGSQPVPGRTNPTGDTADGYAGMPTRCNPC